MSAIQLLLEGFFLPLLNVIRIIITVSPCHIQTHTHAHIHLHNKGYTNSNDDLSAVILFKYLNCQFERPKISS